MHQFALNGSERSGAVVLGQRIRTASPIFTAPAKGTFNMQPNVAQPHPQPRLPELERRSVQEVRDHRNDGLPVPRGGVQRLQSPELERRRLQSDQRHVRQDDRQEQRAEHSALAPLLLLIPFARGFGIRPAFLAGGGRPFFVEWTARMTTLRDEGSTLDAHVPAQWRESSWKLGRR